MGAVSARCRRRTSRRSRAARRSTPAGGALDVAYTPGHASHHVSYFDRESGSRSSATSAASARGRRRSSCRRRRRRTSTSRPGWRASIACSPGIRTALFLTHFGRGRSSRAAHAADGRTPALPRRTSRRTSSRARGDRRGEVGDVRGGDAPRDAGAMLPRPRRRAMSWRCRPITAGRGWRATGRSAELGRPAKGRVRGR